MDDRTERVDTLIIGAGQAGLSAAWHLQRRGLPFAIVDADARVGDHWRQRWDSLRLYSPAIVDALPGMRFPAPRFHYPTGAEMGDYLEAYAERFGLPVRSGVRVDRLSRDAEGTFVARTSAGSIRADQVVVASGAFRTPHVPAFADQLDPAIRQLHSHAYRRPDQLLPGPVLVVGLSHSGADIAIEAAAAHPTIVSGRVHGQVPFRVIDTKKMLVIGPILTFMANHVLTIRTPLGRRMRPLIRQGGGPLLRVRTPDLDAAGVERHAARVSGVRDGKPILEDGTLLDVANIVWATGYRPDYGWIDDPVVGPDGWPEEVRGVSPTVPGLYFLGIPFTYAFSSMLVNGAGRDAGYVVKRIAERMRAGRDDRSLATASAAH